ncbi:uncharacterized protein LOC129614181 [Condylostylus longicornis]|uniref:uncharacterized protein LOC129614181 n=1 Tax=Condylostylus longicornis TaxID=2530218 RepID=UPI00244DFB14|nr:uncharacterized protein LOC129614181 [Condylostylus longicornis]
MKETTTTPRGIRWGIMGRLESLEYADDVALLAQSHSDMQRKINLLSEKARVAGLRINIKKTKSLRINSRNNEQFKINETPIEDVTRFNYLGSIITTDGGAEEDINNRIGLGRAAFGLQIKRRKWRWIGHTLRRPSEAIARQALEWNPQGKRRVGRPRTTWRRTVEKEPGHR